MSIQLPLPELQVGFALALKRMRPLYLQEALLVSVRRLDIPTVDLELARFVPHTDLAQMAEHGLRGELLFAVPALLAANPRLLAYYRLLLGFSQKDFYGSSKGFGVSRFKAMEVSGMLSPANASSLNTLCEAFARCSSHLLAGLGPLRIRRELLDDLTLLTLGPQFRGGANNTLGAAGIVQVFDVIRSIVSHAVTAQSETALKVRSPTQRDFLIEFAPDPDIVIREEMETDDYRNVVAIEVKAGTDVSNIHNRIGEAEKSHQKARRRGFTECWTITNVVKLDLKKAKAESPSTDRFYSLRELKAGTGPEFADFRKRILSLAALPASPEAQKSA